MESPEVADFFLAPEADEVLPVDFFSFEEAAFFLAGEEGFASAFLAAVFFLAFAADEASPAAALPDAVFADAVFAGWGFCGCLRARRLGS